MKHIGKPFKFLWHHKVLSIIGLVILLGVGGYFLSTNGKKESFDTEVVKRGTVSVAIESSGKMKAKQSSQQYFANAARVTWVGVKKGDVVRAGQTLATLDRRELEKTIKQKLSLYKEARWNLEQSYQDNGVKGVPLEKVGLLTDSEKRVIEKNQFTMDSTVWDVEIATLALEQSVLTSPINGTVVDDGKFVAGEYLTTSDVAARFIRIVDLSSLYFQADVDESEYAGVREGMKVTVSLDAFPEKKFQGSVTYVGKEGVKKTGGGIQVPVDITLDASEEPLVPELSGDALIISEEKNDVLVIDKKYARKKGTDYVVDLLRNGKKVEERIDVGLVGVKTLEITGGVAEGDMLVIPKQTTPVASSTEHPSR